MKRSLFYIFMVLYLGAGQAQWAFAQVTNNVSGRETVPLFAADSVIQLTLEGDLESLFKDIGDDRTEHPATLSYVAPDGAPVVLNIKVMTRGNFRRTQLGCNVPPIRLNIKKKEAKQTLFDGQDKLKLVTHCKNRGAQYEQYMLQEYLLYRVYNLFTDYSFRVRLAAITYKSTKGKDRSFTRYGFLIEDDDRMAQRLGGRIIDVKNVHPDSTNREAANLLSVYQYMMGNTDWSIPGLHNIKMVYHESAAPPVAVPYDFDFAGAVNARYAEPSPQLEIKSVQERLFRGFCRTPAAFEATFDQFRAKREAIYALYNAFALLDPKHRKRVLKYYRDFYNMIDKPRRVRREFLGTCRIDR